MIDCPIHGPSPIDRHHKLPRYQGGPDQEDNLEPKCRWCHQELHAQDYDLHLRGWRGLKRKLEEQGIEIKGYMRSLQEIVRERLGEDGYRERMKQVRRGVKAQ